MEHGNNELELRCFSIRRSGHHAILNWIANCLGSSEVFWFNDVPWTEIGKDTIYTERNIKNYGKWRKRYNKKSKYSVYANEHDYNIVLDDKRCLIHSYEDKLLSEAYEHVESTKNGNSDRIFNIVILRDLPNLCASRMAKDNKTGILGLQNKNGKKTIRNFMRGYEEYVDCFLNKSQLDNMICISYNKWFDDISYRKSLCKSLSIPFSDAGKNRIIPAGGGSTFDKQLYDGKANLMKVKDRYKSVCHRPAFRTIMSNSELVEKSDIVFGRIVR